jgi:pyruvate/2-oxoglutarate dehydrogenase complex dihydrolipoamide acyltransferase (E2) component
VGGETSEKPMVIEGRVAIRKCLHVAVSVDHDIIDAEPIVQFISSLVELL